MTNHTVDSIMALAYAYAQSEASSCAREETDEARAELLVAVQKLTAERDAYQVAADQLAGELKALQPQPSGMPFIPWSKEAEMRESWTQPAQPVQEDDPNATSDDLVICPECCSQFRAIPVNVQRLMLDAGFEPPFTVQPVAQPATVDAAMARLENDHDFRNDELRGIRRELTAITQPVQPTNDAAELEIADAVVDRMSKILAEIAITVNGPELPLHRHGYHDLAAKVSILQLEVELHRHQAAQPVAQP